MTTSNLCDTQEEILVQHWQQRALQAEESARELSKTSMINPERVAILLATHVKDSIVLQNQSLLQIITALVVQLQLITSSTNIVNDIQQIAKTLEQVLATFDKPETK